MMMMMVMMMMMMMIMALYPLKAYRSLKSVIIIHFIVKDELMIDSFICDFFAKV